MIHEVKLFPELENDTVVLVDDSLSSHDIEERLRGVGSKFYDTPHGKRETITGYRGCLIVRNTASFSSGGFGSPRVPTRVTAVFLYAEKGWSDGDRPEIFCCKCPQGASIPQAKRYIDRMLERGRRDV